MSGPVPVKAQQQPPPVDVAALNRALKGFTRLVRFELAATGAAEPYTLRLVLSDGKGAERTLLCHDVQNLELNPNGEGFHTLPCLQVEDLRDAGLDRIAYSVDELEQETLFLHCAHVELVE